MKFFRPKCFRGRFFTGTGDGGGGTPTPGTSGSPIGLLLALTYP